MPVDQHVEELTANQQWENCPECGVPFESELVATLYSVVQHSVENTHTVVIAERNRNSKTTVQTVLVDHVKMNAAHQRQNE